MGASPSTGFGAWLSSSRLHQSKTQQNCTISLMFIKSSDEKKMTGKEEGAKKKLKPNDVNFLDHNLVIKKNSSRFPDSPKNKKRGMKMKVAIICEFSGTVRDAFIQKGHDAISFDILPTESPGPHKIGDIQDLPFNYWKQFDLAICHPPCTHLAVSGARWFIEKSKEQEEALNFVKYLMLLPVPKICIENPISIISSRIREPDQIIQPWMFGHGETKKTCLWLKNLPKLKPTNIVEGRENRIHKMAPCKERGKLRSIFYKGIAEAMAEQWS